jgi:hypothetical protein
MTFHSVSSLIRTFLGLRKAAANFQTELLNAQKYDKPCCTLERQIEEANFLLLCIDNSGCFDTGLDEVIKKANRLAKNCGNCSVSEAEIDAFLESEEGGEFILRYGEGGYVLNDLGTFFLTQDGFRILI